MLLLRSPDLSGWLELPRRPYSRFGKGWKTKMWLQMWLPEHDSPSPIFSYRNCDGFFPIVIYSARDIEESAEQGSSVPGVRS